MICDAVRDAVVTDRMGTESEFATWINEEVAIGLMQKLSKTTTFDAAVSNLDIFPSDLLTGVSLTIVRRYGSGDDVCVHGPIPP